ncbi:STAS/SEC14 domain-containing protein [Hymenobacter busanensis]|uniref:STAS/SEC14 domain-containing protein n=1 Tax=Hymenobacter busanensis TaxID=2607656 RepID=A0A7L4ZZ34_9BACT|nr:STAS/SEC14 domain-containing protein [Hymenobacter busanensis]KAA9333009.1 STAS/SEC14 domain-containing protein [Hymenobacter busanensis]QHJ08317.1 hypothetical protein GUY19_13860 [Hymenobacter busanensis]
MLASATRIYFENAAGRLTEDPDGFLRAVWSPGYRRPGEAQALFTHMAQALRQRGWSRIFIDQRHMQPFSPAEQDWVATHWLPAAVRESGYRHGAVLVSPSVMVRLATAYITTQVQNLPLTYFSSETEAEALAWLRAQPATPSGY